MRFKLSHIVLLISVILLLTGCRHFRQAPTAKIRGKIINPRTDEVVVSDNFWILQSDTLKLVAGNEVAGEVKVPKEGLYILYVFPEFQTIYLKPGDSLAFHLNVDEFDESISFSGGVAFENNLNMSVFLANEQESNYFYNRQFQFDLEKFLQKLDSFENIKQSLIDNYKKDLSRTTKKYQQILSLLNKSMYYSLKDMYAQKHPELKFSNDYFSYCSVLHQDLPDANVIYMYAFADSFLERKLKEYHTDIKNPYLKISEIIDHEIFDTAFKDNLLVKYCSRYIKDYHLTKTDSVVHNFYQKIKNPVYKDYCNDLISRFKLMKAENSFPKTQYLTTQKTLISSDSLFNAGTKTLVAFWDLRYRKNFVSNLKKLQAYQKQYPDLQLVIINTNVGQFDEFLLQLPVSNHIRFVQAVDKKMIHQIRPLHLSQVYLLKADTIKASMRNMYEPAFEQKLQKFYSEN